MPDMTMSNLSVFTGSGGVVYYLYSIGLWNIKELFLPGASLPVINSSLSAFFFDLAIFAYTSITIKFDDLVLRCLLSSSFFVNSDSNYLIRSSSCII